MAVINAKEKEKGYAPQWKSEFLKHFNAVRKFNAHRATYAERLALLESLKAMHQRLGSALETGPG